MTNDFYKQGSHNVICDICGKKRKREQCKITWDGYLACTVENCWYPKHPNDYPRKIIPDGYPVQDARPRAQAANWSYIAWPGSGLYTWEASISVWDDPDSEFTWEDDLSTIPNVIIK